ncbi:hypothetical protein EIP86_006864 [Pleurotus ostreatoroseus]|nr:hypothetical protein EIP86_006864 [Pleurotus ostreatoroseus]
MTDADTGVTTEAEAEQGAHDTDSMRTLVDPSSRSQPESDSSMYPDQIGTPLPRVGWSSTCDSGVLNGGKGVRMSDFLRADYFVQARALRSPPDPDNAPNNPARINIGVDISDGDNVAPDRMTLLSTSFGSEPFYIELHWPGYYMPTRWLYVGLPRTSFRRFFHDIALMVYLWLLDQDPSTWVGTLDLENLHLYGLRCIGQDEQGWDRWVLDLNVVRD